MPETKAFDQKYSTIPEADCKEGCKHPRYTAQVFGHKAAKASFLSAFTQARLPSAFILTGAHGIGKATLVWNFVRFLKLHATAAEFDHIGAQNVDSNSDAPFALDPNHPDLKSIQHLSDPNLLLIRRPWDEKTGKFKKDIPISECRRLYDFFALSNRHSGYRMVIIDAVDDMNEHSVNAVLKILEDPPNDACFFLIAHNPTRIKATVLSRCYKIRCMPLDFTDMQKAITQALPDQTAPLDTGLAYISGGSVGRMIDLLAYDGLVMYKELVAIFASKKKIDSHAANVLAQRIANPSNNDDKQTVFALFTYILTMFLHRLSLYPLSKTKQHYVMTDHENTIFNQLSPTLHMAQEWAHSSAAIATALARGWAVNVNTEALVLNSVLHIDAIRRKIDLTVKENQTQ